MSNVQQQEWNSYFSQLSEMEKKSVLLMLKTFLQHRMEGDGRITLEQYNREIDEALEEVERDNYVLQEEMEKRAAKW